MNKTIPLIVIIVVCLIALLFLRGVGQVGQAPENVAAVEPGTHWKLFNDSNTDYQAMFPTPPKAAFNNTLDPKSKQMRVYKLYVSEALDATLFLITEIQFPKDYNPSDDPTILETIVDELVANAPTNSLKESERVQFNGEEALRFKIMNADKMVVMGLAFIHNQSVFILSRVSTEAKVNQKEFDYFTKSFKFKSSNEPSKTNPAEIRS